MKTVRKLIWSLFLLPFVGCSQNKPYTNEYLYLVVDTTGTLMKYGYKDEQGKMVIPFGKYYMCFTDTIKTIGFVAIPKQGFWAINKNDEKLFRVVPFDNGPDYLRNGLFRIFGENDMIGFANMDGEVVIPPQYSYADPFDNNITNFCDGCKTWRESASNDEFKHQKLSRILQIHKDTVLFDRNAKYGAIDIRGDTILQPVYDRIGRFKEDIALAYKDGRAFYIDRSGNEVVYDPKKHPNQKPLDKNINSKIKYIDGWESLLND
ncbi:WG repeat-containing protein [Sphingobacterium alkalisoli]|uniref:WG repeat-containing protein n=1 Tax=Sphingobacterium alkalisoli TaxID=1874115 RepID=A0A4U0H7M5_9SPHI|nr:WG repeat-containing protein [Sphingobacterium alkalisoli]TJY67708.1 WG repeat-containing protein [Sphingobacterium alkalisoli]GGH11854.1 hypothetical protein GCM10011418_11010 [Sphingobacterium alkalisoli]